MTEAAKQLIVIPVHSMGNFFNLLRFQQSGSALEGWG